MTQKWKVDPSLHSCKTVEDNGQVKKTLDYDETYVNEFLEQDPMRDWESISRCIDLFKYCLTKVTTDIKGKSLLDVGTKDGQFVEYTKSLGMDSLGIEISDGYVKWAQDKGRNVIKGNVCDLPKDWDCKFDVTFAHHVLGLTPDYFKAITEMFRVTKIGGIMLLLNDIPGNPKKHFSYVDSTDTYKEWLKHDDLNPHEVVYFGKNPNMPESKEHILFLKKKES